jgi:hypothetical protein
MGLFTKWLEKLYDKLEKCKPVGPDALLETPAGFAYWREYLTERIIRIFEWQGLPMPQRVVEFAVMLTGYAGFVMDEKAGLVCVPGGISGVTPYPMIGTNFVYAAPTCAGGHPRIYPTDPLGLAVIISNNSLRQSFADLVDRYAMLLAHADSSIANSLVNVRYDSFLTGEDDSQVASLKTWRQEVVNGKVVPIVDRSLTNSPAVIPAQGQQKGQIVLDTIDARKEILRSFYAEIGIRVMPEKRGNLITAEVSENDNALLFNISDMLKCRQEAAENINKLYGLKVSVDLSEDFRRLTGSFDGDN